MLQLFLLHHQTFTLPHRSDGTEDEESWSPHTLPHAVKDLWPTQETRPPQLHYTPKPNILARLAIDRTVRKHVRYTTGLSDSLAGRQVV